MNWDTIATIRLSQDWKATPIIAPEFSYIRFSFSTAGLPLTVAQIDLTDRAITDQRNIVASSNSQIHFFESLPVLVDRALALRLLQPSTPFDVKIEVSDMPINRNVSTQVTINTPTAPTAIATTVNASTTSVQLLAANANRKQASFTNTSTGILYLELGATATTAAFTVALNQGDNYEFPIVYTGVVSGVWSNTNGNVLIREFI